MTGTCRSPCLGRFGCPAGETGTNELTGRLPAGPAPERVDIVLLPDGPAGPDGPPGAEIVFPDQPIGPPGR